MQRIMRGERLQMWQYAARPSGGHGSIGVFKDDLNPFFC